MNLEMLQADSRKAPETPGMTQVNSRKALRRPQEGSRKAPGRLHEGSRKALDRLQESPRKASGH